MYPEGRYELRGDGNAASPYHWVWIPTGATPPNPPAVPATTASAVTGRVPAALAWLPGGRRARRPSRPGPIRPGGVYYEGFAVGEVAESAEGSRLLSGYRAKSSVQGSNPCLSATRP